MESKHTKGEWEIDKYNLISCNGKQIISSAPVAYTSDLNDEEAQANAKLIKASPKLLEALQKIHKELTRDNFDIDDIDELISISYTAIKNVNE